MNYTEAYARLNQVFTNRQTRMQADDEGTEIRNVWFSSEKTQFLRNFSQQSDLEARYCQAPSDADIEENVDFTYPVILPRGKLCNQQAIVLLHGLNERSWEKYLVWAWYLARQTGKAVVLFPIAMHMNRSPANWSNARQMVAVSRARVQRYPELSNASFVNAAISERLTNAPQRFAAAGYQSFHDVLRLVRQIQTGGHPFFTAPSQVDLMAYSIGAYLAQVLLLANPDGVFDQSKVSLFCGGTELNQMNGSSKFILDEVAFRRINSYYANEFEDDWQQNKQWKNQFGLHRLGTAFKAMLGPESLLQLKKKTFRRISDQLQLIGLTKDTVVPARNMFATIGKPAAQAPQHQVFDFSYAYDHVTPFPAKNARITRQVNVAFEKVYGQIAHFLS